MPTKIEIPRRVETHCQPCLYHKLTSSFHVRSGPGSYREYACEHPDAFLFRHDGTEIDIKTRDLQAEIQRLQEREGRYIGKTENQPNWCPLKRTP